MATKYNVASGDNLTKIAAKYGTTVDAIAKASGIADPNKLQIGQVITIPDAINNDNNQEYIQDPNNPGASIKNPAYVKPVVDVNKQNQNLNQDQNLNQNQDLNKGTNMPGDVLKQASALDINSKNTILYNALQTLKGRGVDTSLITSSMAGATNDPAKEAEKNKAIADFINEAVGAGMSWKDVQSYIDTQTGGATDEETKKSIYDKYGISGLEEKAYSTPTETFESIYKKAYEDAGLATSKTELEDLVNQIDQATKDYNEALGAINSNPWLTEKSRTKRGTKLYNQYKTKTDNLQSKYTNLSNEYERAQSRIETMATKALSELEKGQTRTKEELKYYVDRAESDVKAAGTTAENSELARYFPEYVTAMKKQKDQEALDKANKSESTKKATNAEIKSAIDSSLKANKAFGTDNLVSWETYLWMEQNWADNGGASSDFKITFPIGKYLNKENQREYNKMTAGI